MLALTVRRLLTLLLAGSLAAGAPAAADAEPRFADTGMAVADSLETDSRHAAYETPEGGVRVFDTRTGAVSEHPRPRPDCAFADVGGGKLLWSCGDGYPIHVVVLKLRTGQVKERDLYVGELGGAVTEVGTYWLKGHGGDHRGGSHTSWWSLATWRQEVDWNGAANEIDDLDRPSFARRMCRPLRRLPNPGYDGEWDNEQWAPFQYDGRAGLYFDQGRWTLDRCGRGPTSLLPTGAVAARLSGGQVTWRKGSKLAAYDVAARRSRSWRRAEIDPAAASATIASTRHALFVAARRSPDDRVERIYRAPLAD